MTLSFRTRSLTTLLSRCALALALSQTWGIPNIQAQSSPPNTVFLPLTVGTGKATPPPTTPTPPPTTPTPPPTTPTQTGVFLNRQVENSSADIAVDKNNGMHAVYQYFNQMGGPTPVVYSSCVGGASVCADASKWQSVTLGEKAKEVQLELTPSGQPRLLITSDSTVYTLGLDYFYAACDQNCFDAASWSLTRIATAYDMLQFGDEERRMPQHSFALDPAGNPRFFYGDRNHWAEPDHYGGFYMACDADCANLDNWSETNLGRRSGYVTERFTFPALTFDAAGHPRLIAKVSGINDDGSEGLTGMYYYTCDAACDDVSGWQRTFLISVGGGSYPHPTWDLALTSQGEPRIALFSGDGYTPADYNNQLLYLYCDTNCLNQDSWSLNFVGLGKGNGEGATLELDAQDRPRIAWTDSAGDLGYSWCNTNCETETAPWQNKVIETEDMLRKEFPRAIPPHCDQDVWQGFAPAMTFDAQGKPLIAYDVAVSARCYYEDPNKPGNPTIKFGSIWNAIHVVSLPQS